MLRKETDARVSISKDPSGSAVPGRCDDPHGQDKVQLLRKSARKADKAGDWKRAADLYEQLSALCELSFWDHHNYARAVLYTGRTADAARLIASLPVAGADRAAVAVLQAELQERLGRYKEAVEHWTKALEAGAPTYWCLFGQARATAKLGRTSKARALMEQALACPERESSGMQFAAWLRQASNHVPGALIESTVRQNAALAEVPMDELLWELMQRLQRGENIASHEERILLAQRVQEDLAERLEVHNNRFSIQRLRDLFCTFYTMLEHKPVIQGASILDLGSGSHNPLGLLFIYVLLGAARAKGVELQDMQDPARAFRAMARAAEVLFSDPKQIVGDYPITRAEIERNLAGFDLQKLREGWEDGLDPTRIRLLQESAESLSIEASSIDVIMSNSFLEHVEVPDSILREMARITAPGGLGIHNIDGVDHASYADPLCHPLEFLRVEQPGMVNDSNRIRVHEFRGLFERHGFETLQINPVRRIPIDKATHQSFASPWREMQREWLEVAMGVIVVRRL